MQMYASGYKQQGSCGVVPAENANVCPCVEMTLAFAGSVLRRRAISPDREILEAVESLQWITLANPVEPSTFATKESRSWRSLVPLPPTAPIYYLFS
jgi:hypothetical protein